MRLRTLLSSGLAPLAGLRGSHVPLLWGCALALMGAALLLEWRVLPPLREELAQLQSRAAAQRLRPPAAAPWPHARQTPQRSEQLVRRAGREGLQVQRLSERTEPASASHSVELRALGSYGSLRRYLAYALAEDPALALESLRLQRPAGPSEGLQLELRWRLLYQPGSER
jgi:hypothetical protein